MNSLKKHVIATDLDNTLVGNRDHLKELSNYFQEAKQEVSFVYLTGRHLASAKQLMKEEQLPQPDILVCDVGATIYFPPFLEEDASWKKQTQVHWQPDEILTTLTQFPEIQLQDIPHLSRVSFKVQEKGKVGIEKIQEALQARNLPHHCIYSLSEDVDILPEGTHKGAALSYILEHFLEPNANVLVAGDSGNDIDMITLGYPAVVVQNGEESLKQHATLPHVYQAQQCYAAGILEGWQYFFDKNKNSLTPNYA